METRISSFRSDPERWFGLPSKRGTAVACPSVTEALDRNYTWVVFSIVALALFTFIALLFLLPPGFGDGVIGGNGIPDENIAHTGTLGRRNAAITDPAVVYQKKDGASAADSATNDDVSSQSGGKSTRSDRDTTGSVPQPDESTVPASGIDGVHISILPNFQRRSDSSSPRSATLGASGFNPFISDSNQTKIIFVVDKSCSMGDIRFSQVRAAVLEALDQLETEQEFQVILFELDHHFCPTQMYLCQATQHNIQRAKRWITDQNSGSGTSPESAVMYALQQNPTRIVHLSDGEFSSSTADGITVNNLRRANPSMSDTIGLAEDVSVLRKIAHESFGTYYSAR